VSAEKVVVAGVCGGIRIFNLGVKEVAGVVAACEHIAERGPGSLLAVPVVVPAGLVARVTFDNLSAEQFQALLALCDHAGKSGARLRPG
jgi:hypothetical protein